MKFLLLIFAIYVNYVICEGNKVAIKSFPKKVRPYGNGKILINSAKYEYKTKEKSTTDLSKKTYTVFQVVGIPKTIQGVPDSPYFPVDQGFDHKPRVKKVLPDYPWSAIRSKRSAVYNAPPAEKNVKKTEKVTTEKPESKLEKIEPTPVPMAIVTKPDQDEEIRKPVRKSATILDKPMEETTEVKEEITTTMKVTTESETKTETTTEKPAERAGNTKKSSKASKQGDSKTAKNNDPPRERKSESKSAKKDEPKSVKLTDARSKKSQAKSNGTSNTKSKNTDSLKELKSEGRAASGKGKSKSEATDVERTNRKIKSKPKVISAEATVNVKVKSKDKGKNATNVRAKSKGKEKKTDVAIVRAKEVVDAPAVKNKKNVKAARGNTGSGTSKKKDKKRKGNSNSKVAPQRSKNRKPKKGQKSTNITRTVKKPKAQRRLIAAREALIEDYPYVVSIQKDDQHWCSGALLNPRLVITTANCLWKANRITRMEVRAGSRFVDRGGQMAGIQEVMKHPGWGLRRSPDNDVALVLLDRNMKFTDKIHGVDLPNRVMLPAFDDAWVTSWGSERRDGVYDIDSSTLQVYHTRLMDREKCNNITMRFSVIVTENFICLSQSGRTAPCTRDTGAPAVSDGILWGLASWGIRKLCGTERFPSMFSYLASHSNLDFITNATHFLMADKRLYPYADRFPAGRIGDVRK